ncbi:MAG: hypothetical protein M5U28_53235 [Sandaracinaceae bacterium]|nr:hypothetical protein [Sandaracinaceae bacterium]
MDGEWERARERIESDPDRYGWEHEGRIVAPSARRPLHPATSIAQLLLTERGVDRGVTEQLYRDAYASAGTVFREDARVVVEAAPRERRAGLRGDQLRTSRCRRRSSASRRAAASGSSCAATRASGCWQSRSAPTRFAEIPEELRVPGCAPRAPPPAAATSTSSRRSGRRPAPRPRARSSAATSTSSTSPCRPSSRARVHMVGRPSTPAYEREAVGRAGGTFSTELAGLLPLLG